MDKPKLVAIVTMVVSVACLVLLAYLVKEAGYVSDFKPAVVEYTPQSGVKLVLTQKLDESAEDFGRRCVRASKAIEKGMAEERR